MTAYQVPLFNLKGPPGPKGADGDDGDEDITPEEIQIAVEAYLSAHPVTGSTVHVQSIPSASWIVNHNYGRLPNVTVYIDGFLVLAEVQATTTQVVIPHPSPKTGVVILS